MSGATPSQPGWYPDHSGAMRWFDGTAWTDHVQPGSGGLAGAADATAAGSAGPTPTQPLGQYPDSPGWQGGQPQGPHTGPPPSPPSGQQLPPYGAVPQPSFPGGPGGPGPGGPGGPPFQPSSGGGNKGLLILLAVVGAIVLIAVLAVGAWAAFLRDDDSDSDGGGGGGDAAGSLPEPGPAEVVQAFFDAAEAGDCQAALDLVSENFVEENDANCDNPEDFMEDAGEFETEIGEATIDEEADPPSAVVPVTLTIPEFGAQDVPFHMVVEDDEWKIDAIDEPGDDSGTDSPSPSLTVPDPTSTDFTIPTIPSDLESYFSDLPTDPSELESYFSEYLTQTP